ncbi:hypothetical protein IGI37_003745 [Enterococcus sp. AZ194]|uniref:polyketide cyclase n=1 Tax=Enterococcus sp. AZ194 TaxID=2774629 RepID=UPI003F2883D6
MKRTSKIVYEIHNPVEVIWSVVTNNAEYTWRSDIDKIELLSEQKFREYYLPNGHTDFTIKEKIENKRYVFEMENPMFTGEWIGEFIELTPEKTQLVFTEILDFKNSLIYLVSFVMMNLKKIQMKYMVDLEKEVERR